jgi:hypothetical protein
MTTENIETLGNAECSWTGVSEDGQEVVRCGRRAHALVTGRSGQSAYACEEHMSQVKASLETGRSIYVQQGPGPREDLSRRVAVV